MTARSTNLQIDQDSNHSSLVAGDAFFRSSVQNLAEMMDVRFGFIAKKEAEDASTIKTIAIWDTDRIIDNFSYPIKDTPCEYVLSTGLSVYPDRVAESFPKDLWLKENGIESYIGIPLFNNNGSFLGHMGVIDDKPMSNTDEKINLLRIFATSVANEMERQKSETALQISESRLNFLVSSTPVTIYTCEATPPFAVTYISPNIRQLMGYEPEQFTNNSGFWAENIHPEDQQQVFDNLTQVFEHGVHQHEYRFKKQDGSYCWMRDELRLIKDENNHPVEMVGYWADISDRKLTEQALEKNKERLRRGQVFANIGTWDWDIQTGDLFWSERIAPLFGYPDGELETSYENFIGAIHPDDRQMVSDAVTACIEQDIAYDIEHRVLWPDGTIHWLHERGAVTRDADGQPQHMLGVVQDIHNHKEAESKLKHSEERFAFAVEGAGDGIWDWDMRSNDMQFSRLYMKMLGYAENELPQHVDTWVGSVHPDDLARVQQNLQEYLEGQTSIYYVELRLRCKDGSYKWILCRGQVVDRDEDKNPIRMIGIHSDITEQKLAHVELNRFKTTLDMTKDCVFMFEPASLKFFYVNQGAIEQFGYGEAELMNMTAVDIKPDFDEAQFRQFINPLIKGETDLLTFDTIHQHKNGLKIPVEISLQHIEPEGESARFVSIVRNISDRKIMQEQMEQQTKLLDMLHRSTTDFVEKGNFKVIMNNMLDTLLELTESEYGFIGEVFYEDGAPYLKTHSITNIAWNTETQALYDEFERKGFEFRNLNTLFGHVMTSRKSVVCNDPATDPRSAGLPEGHPAMHCFLGVPIFYGKEMVGMYGIANRKNGYDKNIRDFLRTFDTTYGVMIHSQRMTEMEISNRKELVHAKEIAERASKAKSEFLSNMSHELRTPMNAILGFGQLLEFDKSMPKVQQDNVQEILTAGHHLLNLINEVLDLAKVESGHIELSLEPVDVHQVVEECFTLVETLAKKHNIRISHSVLKGVAVRADHTRFKQVLINLLSNAIKYNHEGGNVKLETLHDDYDKDRLKILVIDTGIGIPDASLADLFQPFNRLDAENSNVEGTGIGLTITRRIVEMMGGMIYVQSEVGVGSTFTIELPLESLAEHDDIETVGDDMTSSQTQLKIQHTILYIEDNPANLNLVAQIMGRRKHVHLLTAHTPEIGIKLARERLPELILLDINMPNINGYEVMEIFKADASLKNIPVIAVTANAMSRDIERGKAAGFSDYITKPIDVTKFLNIMDNYLPIKKPD